MTDPNPSLAFRLWFSFACWLRVLADGAYARRVHALEAEVPELPPAKDEISLPTKPEVDTTGALTLLSLLQREGRLVDFLQQDVDTFSDEEIGAAVRVVHAGCRKALRSHATVEPVRPEDEGTPVTLEEGFDASAVRLTGNVRGSAPHRGVLRHRGWRATALELPEPIDGHDPSILAPAEVEL